LFYYAASCYANDIPPPPAGFAGGLGAPALTIGSPKKSSSTGAQAAPAALKLTLPLATFFGGGGGLHPLP
jgi:hypothetical protein